MATEKRLIDANDVKELINGLSELPWEEEVDYLVDGLPTVDAVEVVHGEWSTIEDDYCGLTALQCSECNQEYWFEDEPPTKIYNYCPNCGAKMDGGSHEID